MKSGQIWNIVESWYQSRIDTLKYMMCMYHILVVIETEIERVILYHLVWLFWRIPLHHPPSPSFYLPMVRDSVTLPDSAAHPHSAPPVRKCLPQSIGCSCGSLPPFPYHSLLIGCYWAQFLNGVDWSCHLLKYGVENDMYLWKWSCFDYLVGPLGTSYHHSLGCYHYMLDGWQVARRWWTVVGHVTWPPSLDNWHNLDTLQQLLHDWEGCRCNSLYWKQKLPYNYHKTWVKYQPCAELVFHPRLKVKGLYLVHSLLTPIKGFSWILSQMMTTSGRHTECMFQQC